MLSWILTLIPPWNLIKIIVLILASFYGVMSIILSCHIVKNYEISDDYLAQIRTNAELENIKLIKELGYKPNEEEFTNPLRRLIGKEPIFKKEKNERYNQERKNFKERWKSSKKEKD